MSRPAIIVHGGCGKVEESSIPERLKGVEEAAKEGWKVLLAGGSAVDAVEAAVLILEDNPLFNAGTGSALNSEGRIEADAAIMDGARLATGGVAAVTGILNPIRLARRLMEVGPPVLLVARGAEQFARSQGIAKCELERLVTKHRRQEWEDAHGTVGASACDAVGRLAAGTSTGGHFNKLPGRVGDSPLVGCGTYADAQVAISCTGSGEQIIRMTLARLGAFIYQELGNSQRACNKTLQEFESTFDGEIGLILVDRLGQPAFAKNSCHMPVCAITADGVSTVC
ncbi:MAG TPA: isoaspartyl peptidase/L-asparaginase family protein [Steroidobacteraceae bacterium]|nr:isoaspartyl peptidase/L-asparaginase family protein [Steroidobacteraceae bacterium]